MQCNVFEYKAVQCMQCNVLHWRTVYKILVASGSAEHLPFPPIGFVFNKNRLYNTIWSTILEMGSRETRQGSSVLTDPNLTKLHWLSDTHPLTKLWGRYRICAQFNNSRHYRVEWWGPYGLPQSAGHINNGWCFNIRQIYRFGMRPLTRHTVKTIMEF